MTERLWEDYVAFTSRDLVGPPILYPVSGRVAERLHLGQLREPVLAAWGSRPLGPKVLLGLYVASKEDTASARECLRDKAQGMNDPALVATDGAPGLIRAVEEVFPQSPAPALFGPIRRCATWAQKCPRNAGAIVKAHRPAAYQALSPLAARGDQNHSAEEFGVATNREFHPAPWPASTRTTLRRASLHLRDPADRPTARAIRTTNLLERLFGELLTAADQIIPHAFGERAVLEIDVRRPGLRQPVRRRLVISEFELKQIEELKPSCTGFQQRTARRHHPPHPGVSIFPASGTRDRIEILTPPADLYQQIEARLL